jgi:hypothetical protein
MNESEAGFLVACFVVLAIILIIIEITLSDFRDKFINKDFRTNKLDEIKGELFTIRRQQEQIMKELREIKRAKETGQK